MKRFQRDGWFMVGNTVFWIGLACVLLSSPARFFLGASILAILIGGGVLYLVWRRAYSPSVRLSPLIMVSIRLLFLIMGVGALVGGVVGILWFSNGGDSVFRQSAVEKIEWASREDVQRLDLSGMGLTSLPPELWHLSNLVSLDLYNNKLTTLPPQIGQMVRLRTLHLSSNRLTALPPEIGQLSDLKYLYLNENQLTELPPEIGQLGQLSSLLLTDNELTALPDEIGQLSELKFLSLSYNRLTSLPAEFVHLDNLQMLWLEGNPFDELPPEVAGLANGVDIEYDPAATIPPKLDGNTVDFVCSSVIILAFVLAWALDRWLARREIAFQRQSQRIGQVFPIPSFARAYCIFALLLAGFVSLLLFASGLNAGRTNVSLETGVGVPLILLPAVLFCVYMLMHNSGTVVLTDEAVMLHCFWREQCLAYSDIIDIKQGGIGLPPTLILKGKRVTLKIPRSASAFPSLYQAIGQRVQAQDMGESPRFP